MGFLDKLTGRKPQQEAQPAEPVPEQPTTSGVTAAELMRDVAPGAGAGGQPGARLYDPYEGLSGSVPQRRAAYRLPEAPEFVFHEDAAMHRRSWGENLQFYTGMGYLGGGITGFALGGYQYMQLPAEPALDSMKLKANRLINTSGSLGRRFACGSAVLGLYFASFESLLHYLNDGRIPDEAVTSAAGFTTAALYRSSRGPRLAAVAGMVGATAAAGLAAARQQFPSL